MSLRIFSSGTAWERAFDEAVAFLEKSEGTLLLGPGIGPYAKEWLEEQWLAEGPNGNGKVRFGNRIQDWKEWVKGRARDHALSLGHGFRTLDGPATRELLRESLHTLSGLDAFHHLKELWPEEQFFHGLVGCVEEARCAGLFEGDTIDRAKELLAEGADAITSQAYNDLWYLLELYENRLSAAGDTRLDYAAQLRWAVQNTAGAGGLFLLGFDSLNLLEAELLRELARGEAVVHLPLALHESLIRDLVAAKAAPLDSPAALSLQGLLTGFIGKVEIATGEEAVGPKKIRLLAGHTPEAEGRAAAALGRAVLGNSAFECVRTVVPHSYFQDRSVALAFQEELGLPPSFCERKSIEHPVSRLFFHVLELKQMDFSLHHGLELAQLVEFTQGRFGDVPSRAAKAGVRKGLADWKRKAGQDRELQEFGVLLEKIDRLLPAEGTAEKFAEVCERVAEEVGVAELARRAPGDEEEREAHAALSSLLRNAAKLAASTKQVFSFPAWMKELKALLEQGKVAEAPSFFPKVQFYSLGEWLPPASDRTLTIVLGLNQGVEPRLGFQFFFEEAARRKLSELLLPTQVQQGLGFLDQVSRLGREKGRVLLSFARHDAGGKECEPSWVCGTFDLVKGSWPEIPRDREASPYRTEASVKVSAGGAIGLSASFLESYKSCPFKSFAEKVLGLEDKMQESSLDVSRLDEGSFVHKVLELYYGKRNGQAIGSAEDRKSALSACLEEVLEEFRAGIRYYKGSESLFEVQVAGLRRHLENFVELDAENYARFPFWGQPEVEKEVHGQIAGKPWKGKIDRVDYDHANKRFLVLDYKIGASPPSNKEVSELERFQLQLYADAVQAEKPDYRPVGGLYASITSGDRNTGFLRKEFNCTSKKWVPAAGDEKYYKLGSASKALLDENAFEAFRERTRKEAEALAGKIASGEFPVSPLDEENSCKRCSVRPACRIRELRSPPLEPWLRPAPAALLALLKEPSAEEQKEKKKNPFNEEQQDALGRRGQLVFIEASAGTGKTTVIVERVKQFLAERLKVEPGHLAAERFTAISFTEKSAQELGARLAASLLEDPAFGPRLAAQAQRQISTIHGFCRRILSDFPLEAGVSPMSAMLDDKGTNALRKEVMENFFLFPDEETTARFEKVFEHFTRAKLEEILSKLLSDRMLIEMEVAKFRAGAEGLFPSGMVGEMLSHLLALADSLHSAYSAAKREKAVLDFNDLEALSLKVLEKEEAREFYRKKFELLLVDEFQDTNSVQRTIFERIARPDWSNVFVVGDAKQSIYRFRAADVSIFQELRKAAGHKGQLVTLGRNYRSSPVIVECANRITKAILPAPGDEAPSFEAFDAQSIPGLKTEGRVALVEYGDPEEDLNANERRKTEARGVAALVREIRERSPGKSIAILLRKVNGNEAYMQALTDAGISYRVGSSKGFYGQSVVMDSIALLRVLYGAKNNIALLALMRSPWGRLSPDQILEVQRRGQKRDPLWDKLAESEMPQLFFWKKKSTHSSLAAILEEAHRFYPMGRRESLQAQKLVELVERLESEAQTRAEILELLSAWAGWDSEDDASDDGVMPEPAGEGGVQLMTVHASKGLEFDVTILADLCAPLNKDQSSLRIVRGEGISLKVNDEEGEGYREAYQLNRERELAELKRLFYVASTRAKSEQYFFLPRWQKAEADQKKWNHCAHFLLAADLSGLAEKVDGDELIARKLSSFGPAVEGESKEAWPLPPSYKRFRQSSITELAAYQFCPEFHRRKFVQGWDDRIVELWPRPKGSFRKFKAKGPKDPQAESVAKLLKALKIERKERGIALHRVLERVKEAQAGLELASVWLREAYEAQGVPPDHERLGELIDLDLALLRNFLGSSLGREVFDGESEAFPEITFRWRVGGVTLHGAMDRLLRKPDGRWMVVDYKSSVHEESFDRYRFQVASYMAAVRASEGLGSAVEGYLIDLYSSTSHPVLSLHDNAMHQIKEELKSTAENYTATGNKNRLEEQNLSGGEHCFSCPYSLHCEIGKKVVLPFS